MKTVYQINAICVCKDAATMATISAALLSQLKTQKGNGNILTGQIHQSTTDVPDSSTNTTEVT